MPRKFSDLRDRMSPERRKRNEERVHRELLSMNLQEIRKNLASLTQQEVAALLEKSQATISELEQREDMLFSTLAEYVKVLGGELEIRARFPGREDVIVNQFSHVREQILSGR
jgi:hypothetical protein